MGRIKRVLHCSAIAVLFLLIAGCTPPIKHNPPEISPRYKKKANRENVFEQSLFGISAFAKGFERQTDLNTGFIRSMPFSPPDKVYKVPTRYYVTCQIKPSEDKTYYLPHFELHAEESRDRRNWREIKPPAIYKAYLENDMQTRVINMVVGNYVANLKQDQYLGFVIIRDNEPFYADPEGKQLLTITRRFQFGELQFMGFRTENVYAGELMKVKFEINPGEKTVGWIHEDAVTVFFFAFVGNVKGADGYRKLYDHHYIKAACRQVGQIKGKEEEWPARIMQAVLSGKVVEGMTEEQVVCTLGPPTDTHSDVNAAAGIESSYFVYKDPLTEKTYGKIYFVNGRTVRNTHD